MSGPSLTRASSTSTLSGITLGDNAASKFSSVAPSTTPPTSAGDNADFDRAFDASLHATRKRRYPTRLSARMDMPATEDVRDHFSNETEAHERAGGIHDGAFLRPDSRENIGSRTISNLTFASTTTGLTIFANNTSPSQQLIRESTQLCDLDGAPHQHDYPSEKENNGARIKQESPEAEPEEEGVKHAPKLRRSTRLGLLERATNLVGRTTAVLGKTALGRRGREVLDAGMGRVATTALRKNGREEIDMRIEGVATTVLGDKGRDVIDTGIEDTTMTAREMIDMEIESVTITGLDTSGREMIDTETERGTTTGRGKRREVINTDNEKTTITALGKRGRETTATRRVQDTTTALGKRRREGIDTMIGEETTATGESECEESTTSRYKATRTALGKRRREEVNTEIDMVTTTALGEGGRKTLTTRRGRVTTTALGKRGRRVIDTGIEKEKSAEAEVDKRATLRPRAPPGHRKTVEEPDTKRAKVEKKIDTLRSGGKALASTSTQTETETEAQKKAQVTTAPSIKRWLSHGLYVGQERDSHARSTNAKSKSKTGQSLKKSSATDDVVTKKENKAMPLPMFAGQRLLEQGRDFKLPFDVFNPLPPGQPKPAPWKKTQKNIFVGEAATIWKSTARREHSTCLCTPSSGCGDACINRLMFYECDATNCAIGPAHCTNRQFEALRLRQQPSGRRSRDRFHAGVDVFETADRGFGVRANRAFAPGQIIAEYCGEIITRDEAERRLRERQGGNKCSYLLLFDHSLLIDAHSAGSPARFVNHSCHPNCHMAKWTVAGRPRMALFAGDHGVRPAEELSYDYNFDPCFSGGDLLLCRCGAPDCRGVLGPRPREAAGRKRKGLAEEGGGAGEGLAEGPKRRRGGRR